MMRVGNRIWHLVLTASAACASVNASALAQTNPSVSAETNKPRAIAQQQVLQVLTPVGTSNLQQVSKTLAPNDSLVAQENAVKTSPLPLDDKPRAVYSSDDAGPIVPEGSILSQPMLSTEQSAAPCNGACQANGPYQMMPLESVVGGCCRTAGCPMTCGEAAKQSLFGDVYAPGTWRPLSLDGLLSDGWNEPWAGGPAGTSGLTPRHGWLGANDGVFYRLWLNTFTYQNTTQIGNGLTSDARSNTFSIFLPLSRRLEVLLDVPYTVTNSTSTLPPIGSASASQHTRFGDVIVTPRVLLSETERVSQVFAVGVETPTGQVITGGGHTSLTPRYEFWSNPTGAWVARGGWGVNVPIDNSTNSQTRGVGNFAVGRYLTKHEDMIGDLVLYGAANMTVPLNGAGGTSLGIGPGTRFHVANNWFVLGFANFIVSTPQPYNYQTQVALMKVF